jgi:hypothetical protein
MTAIPERTRISLPEGVRLIAEPARLDFLHSAGAPVRPGLTAFEAYCEMTANISSLLRFAFFLRDKISRLFNVEEIRGFAKDRPRMIPKAGSKLDFFAVESISDHQLVLTSKDSHLAVMVSLDIVPPVESNSAVMGSRWLYVTASVETHNAFGKAYMLPVSPVHRAIVRRMLQSVEE